MPAIDPEALTVAMDATNTTASELAERCGISLQYACDVRAGRRGLKRNPELRAAIAAALTTERTPNGVPVRWIEHPGHDGATR